MCRRTTPIKAAQRESPILYFKRRSIEWMTEWMKNEWVAIERELPIPFCLFVDLAMQVLLLVPLLNKSGLIKRMRISQNRRIKHVLSLLYYKKYPANLLGFFYCTVCTICIYVVDKNTYSVRMVLLSSHPHPPHPHPHPKSSIILIMVIVLDNDDDDEGW